MRRILTAAIYLLAMASGVAAYLFPFLLPANTAENENFTLLLTMALLGLALMVLILEVQGQVIGAKIVAALGMLVAIAAVLRFIEVAIPGPGGFSPIFAPIILAGYVFGGRFGFLLGALSMLVSALLTGGVGPWLPYQMFTSGWIGLTSGWLPHPTRPRGELLLLAGWGFAWGLIYGVLINLYAWPLLAGGSGAGWQPGIGLADGAARYGAFYLATSFVWDLGRAGGNVALILVLGLPALRALSRFRDRFRYELAAG